MRILTVLTVCFLLPLGACNDTLGLADRVFTCGPALPCAPGYTCRLDPTLDAFACSKDPKPTPEDATNGDTTDVDTQIADSNQDTTSLVDLPPIDDTLLDTMNTETLSDSGSVSPDASSSDTFIDDVSDISDAVPIEDTSGPVVPCDPSTDSLCFSPCSGWKENLSIPSSATAPGALFVDMGGNGTMETIIFGGTGFKIADYQGNVLAQTIQKNSSTFARGVPVAVDLTPPTTQTVFAKELSLLMAPAQNASTLTWQVGPETGKKEFLLDQTNVETYDLTQFLAADMDFDGLPEFVAGHGCDPVIDLFGTTKEQYPALGSLVKLASISSNGVDCSYSAGRLLTDLDGDSEFELLVGRGFANAEKTELWNGDIEVYQVFPENQNNEQSCDECFNTDKPPLHKSGVTDLFRQGDVIHAVVRYFATQGPPALGGTYYHWQFDTAGNPLTAPALVSSPKALLPVSLKPGSPDISVPEVRSVGLWDVNGDNFPDRITTEYKDLVLELYDSATGTFIEHKEARKNLDEVAVVRSIGQRKSEEANRLDILVAYKDGNVECMQMGKDTYNRDGSIPPYESPYYRTNQKDNYEPNDGSALPAFLKGKFRIPWLPTNLTGFGKAWSYLESEQDVDFFQVKVAIGSEICIRSPVGDYAYEFSVSSTENPHDPLWESTSVDSPNGAPHTKCVKPSTEPSLSPVLSIAEGTDYKIGLFVIRVYSNGPVHPDRPYWIDTPGILAWDGLEGFGG